jgi:hypothetical protein
MSKRVKTIDDFSAEELAAMPRSARPIGHPKLTEKEFAEKYAYKRRIGKTAKDHRRR